MARGEVGFDIPPYEDDIPTAAEKLAIRIYQSRFGQTPAPLSSWMVEVVPLIEEAFKTIREKS
jgi:hypothetical protein